MVETNFKTAWVHFVHLVIVSGMFAIAESRLGVRFGYDDLVLRHDGVNSPRSFMADLLD